MTQAGELAETFGERLDKALKARRLTVRAAAKRLELSREGDITDWKAERRFPNPYELAGLVRALDVDANWLLLGEGQMDRAAPEKETTRLALEVQRLARELQRIVSRAIPATVDPVPLAEARGLLNRAKQIAEAAETTTPLGEQRRLPKQARGNLGG